MNVKSLFRIIALCAVMLAACSKMPSEPDPGPGPIPPPPSGITFDDLKVNEVKVLPEANDRIYAPVVFALDDTGEWRGKIEHYKADLTQLKASFKMVAAKVTVAGVEQTSGVTANDFSKPVVYRLYADDGQYKEWTVELANGTGTGAPLVAVFTDGGAPIVSKEEWLGGRIVIDPQDSEFERLDIAMDIKGRGNNTWRLDKKPYAIKLSEKSPVMGMNKHKRWVLLANASDRTLLRNRVAFEIGRRTGLAWTPDSRFVEVMVNGVYRGSYLLCEQIKIDKNRVNIPEMEPGDTQGDAVTGGYLLELDRYYDEINKFRTTLRDLPINIKEPDEEVLGAEQKKYVSDYVNHVEELLYGGAQVDEAYRDWIDVDSFIDWWIVMELTTNRDSRLPGSCYMYKARGGKLFAGPLWDFDLTTFKSENGFMLADYETVNPPFDPMYPNKIEGDRSLWYKRLFSDPVFAARARERWAQYQGAFAGIPDFIETEAAALEASAGVNWAMWTIDSGINHDETLTWEEAVAKLKENYSKRLERLNTLIPQL